MSRKDKQKDKQRTPAEGAETKRVTPVDINRFLGREREFLQALASRIQSHIEAVRDDARSAKSALEAEAAGASGWSGSAESSGAPVSEPDLPVSGHADQDAHDAEEHTGHSFESAAGPATAWSGLPAEEETARPAI